MSGILAEYIKLAVGFDNANLLKGIAESNKAIMGFRKTINNFLKFTGISFLTKMAADAANLGRNLSIVSQQLGIATSRLSKMQSAFASIGIKSESINAVLTGISEGLAGLAFGEGEYASKLSAMGISAWDNRGREKEADTILGDIAQWTKTQLDAGRSFQQVALYLKKNFNIQTDLALRLAKGQEAFENFIKEQSEKTGSLYDFQVEGLSELSEDFNTLWETIKVFKNQLAADLGPVIKGVVEVFQVVVKEVADIWNNLMLAIEEIIGETNILSNSFKFLKDVVKVLGAVIKQAINIIEFILMAVKEAGQAVGEFITNMLLKLQEGIAWLFKKLGFDTRTDEEKYRDELKEKVASGELTAPEAVRLLNDYRKAQERKKLEKKENLFEEPERPTTKDLITGEKVYLDGTPVKEVPIVENIIEPDEYDFEQPIYPTGREVISADTSGSAPIVNLDISSNATYNEADGTIQQDISVNGVSKGNSSGENIEYMYQSVTGD